MAAAAGDAENRGTAVGFVGTLALAKASAEGWKTEECNVRQRAIRLNGRPKVILSYEQSCIV
jgi:hypothetical protein